jgi:hypothetical protein
VCGGGFDGVPVQGQSATRQWLRAMWSRRRAAALQSVGRTGLAVLTLVMRAYYATDAVYRYGSKDRQLLCANCQWIKRCEKGEAPGNPQHKGR